MRLYPLPVAAALLTGCAVGPNYKRPDVSLPPQFRQPVAQTATTESVADAPWTTVFADDTITALVRTALAQNNDLKAAAERVLEARAQLGITRSQLAPELTASASFTASRGSSVGSIIFVPPGTNLAVSYTSAGANVAWELDLWGRIRRLTESARAQYLAQEEVRHGVTSSLIADVITTYLDLRELDLELEIAKQTEQAAQRGLELTRIRKERGAITGLDVRQAEQLLYTATSQIAATERAITETENALSVLLGDNPHDITRGKPLIEIKANTSVPAGLPADLLARRPDIRQAEQNLISANAQIGAARALYFPQITLTGLLGLQSRALTGLVAGNARNQSIAPEVVLPIFNAGRIRNQVRFSEAQQRELVFAYRKSIQTGLQEVSNALTQIQKNREQREQQEKLVAALQDTVRLSDLRYRGGLDSYLQVLDAQRNLFSGQLVLAQLRRNELLSSIYLYRALGGGWQNP